MVKEVNKIKIGIDLDGVVIDSETTFRTYEEIYDIDVLKQNSLVDRKEPKFQSRYNWNIEQQKDFCERYFLQVAKESNLMSGFIAIYNRLKKQGHEFVVITARGLMPDGSFMKEMEDDAKSVLIKNNILIDKYYWRQKDKLEVCLKEKIDIMIDDDWRIIKKLSDNDVKTLYFRDTRLKKLEETEYIGEVNNWGDVYRKINT